MASNIEMSYIDAVEQCIEIIQRQIKAVPDKRDDLICEIRVKSFIQLYKLFNLDNALKYITSIEKHHDTFKEELTYLIVQYLKSRNKSPYEIIKDYRFEGLYQKYLNNFEFKFLGIITMDMCFYDNFYDIMKEIPSICPPLSRLIEYKNFKKEHQFVGILSFLPAGGKYGGLIKALHVYFKYVEFKYIFGPIQHETLILILFTICYNSKFISQDKRKEWFKKFEVNESDCLNWSIKFDRDYPQYAYIHKLFDQIA